MGPGAFTSKSVRQVRDRQNDVVLPLRKSRSSGNPVATLLASVAMLAVLYRYDEEGAQIQAVASRVVRDPGTFLVAYALIHVFRGDSARAVDILTEAERTTIASGHHDLGRAVLACALRELGEPSWKRICAELIRSSGHDEAKQLCLEQMRHHVYGC